VAVFGLILLLAVAAGLTHIPTHEAPPKKEPYKGLYLHETAWGFVPIIGSYDQMINGRNWFSQLVGAVFLVMDISLVGGIARIGAKGLLFSINAAGRKALGKTVAEAGVNSVERLSYEELMRSGAVKALSEEQAQTMLRGLAQPGKTAVIVGTQSGKQGVYHSIMYVIADGKIYRLHGGISKYAAGGEIRAAKAGGTGFDQALKQGWNKGWNSFTVYSAEELAAKEISDATLMNLANGWEKKFPSMYGPLQNICSARGCANSQWILMDKLGLATNVAEGSLHQYLPYLLETSRMSGAAGAHYTVNVGKVGAATFMHTLLPTLGAASYVGGSGTARIVAQDLLPGAPPRNAAADMLPTQLENQLTAYLNTNSGHYVMVPGNAVDLAGELAKFPGDGNQFSVEMVDPALIQTPSFPASGSRIPGLGGGIRVTPIVGN
jgi:hypothetical protein